MANPWDTDPLDTPAPSDAPWLNDKITAGPSGGMPPINFNREGLAPERFMAGLKMGPEGVASYLEGRYGKGNVATDKGGAFYVKDKNEWIPFDSPKLTPRDAFDFSGLAVAAAPVLGGEAALGRAATSIPGMLGRTAAEGLAGSAAQQAVGAATPGGDPMSLTDRAVRTGADTIASVGGGIVSRALNRAVGTSRNIYLTQTGQADAPVARQGQEISDYLTGAYNPATDGPMDPSLTPGQRSQRKSLLTLEGGLRRSPTAAADLMQNKDTAQLLAAKRRYDQLTSYISANPANAVSLGNSVTKAFGDTLDGALAAREAQARTDFAAIDTAAGRRPIVQPTQTLQAIDGILNEYAIPGGNTGATGSLVRQLKAIRNDLVRTGPNGQPLGVNQLSASDLNKMLAQWGRAAEGSSQPFERVDAAEQKRLATRIFAGLNNDLDTVVAQPPSADTVLASSLRQARDAYRDNSSAITDLRKSAIGQYLGFQDPRALAPEAVAARLGNMHPSQLRQTFTLLDRAAPDLAQDTKRLMLEKVMTAAEPSAEQISAKLGQGATDPTAYSPAMFLANLKKSPLLDVLSPNEKFGVQRLSFAMQRLANRAGTEGSPTFGLTYAMDIAKNIVAAGVTGDVVGAFKVASSIFGPRKLAEAITNPQSLNALVALTQPKLTREAALTAATSLGFLGATRGGSEDVRPFAPTAALSGSQYIQ